MICSSVGCAGPLRTRVCAASCSTSASSTVRVMGSLRTLLVVPAPAREPVSTMPPSAGAAPELELEACPRPRSPTSGGPPSEPPAEATGQIIVSASWTNGLGSQSSNQKVPPIKSKSSAPLPGSFSCAVVSLTSSLKPAWVRRYTDTVGKRTLHTWEVNPMFLRPAVVKITSFSP